ncbi:DNA cytosine methyltransferase [Achromobacter insolitus]|uniref:DNA cytosine methyltransferase n=1 Tax=Achromobacter insolitus TaxID=217204 RepID=UPI001EED545E|nr:DNA (cytosine-5-)-methyltransferase [Achromobacter insolitus]
MGHRVQRFKFIDLFAGLGGFHIALDKLGGRCVFAAEWQLHLQDLYFQNFGLRPQGDIREVSPASVPDHDVLCAGFPCQPFSKAGEQLGFECTRQGDLFFNVAAIIEAKTPSYFILENVPNLLQHDGGRTFERIKSILIELGYQVDARRFSPHQFGIPQIRERVYIVGARTGLAGFAWPEPTNEPTNIKSVLEQQPVDAKLLSPQVERCLEVWDDFLRRSPSDIELPSFPIWSMEFGADYPYADGTPYAVLSEKGTRGLTKFRGSHGVPLRQFEPAERWAALPSHARTEQLEFPKWKQDFIRQNREFYANNRKWIDPWLSKILQFPSSLQKLEWNAKGGERDIWRYVIQFRASGVRIKRPTTAPSLIAMTDTQVPIIGWEKRYMTPRECAGLQSLGALSLPENRSRAFAALGNAVNANVVGGIASNLIADFKTPRPHEVRHAYRQVVHA